MELEDALDQLAPEFREAVLLADQAELEYQEIAACLGVPIGTVRSWVNRGRAKLAEISAVESAGDGNSRPARCITPFMDRPVTETEVLVSSADLARLRRAFEAVTTAPVDELTRRREVRFGDAASADRWTAEP